MVKKKVKIYKIVKKFKDKVAILEILWRYRYNSGVLGKISLSVVSHEQKQSFKYNDEYWRQ